jgi:hypothetical protein
MLHSSNLDVSMSAPGHEEPLCDGRSRVCFSRKRRTAAARQPAALGQEPTCRTAKDFFVLQYRAQR